MSALPQTQPLEPATAAPTSASPRLADGSWRPAELVFWTLPVLAYLAFPEHLLLINQMMIVGLFALSLDLLVGYARIASLGHAAFFGVGAYTAGLLSVHGWGEPVSGLLAAGATAGLFGWVNAPVLLGDITVAPGDLVVGDADGVVAIPRERAGAVVEASHQREAREAEVMKRLLAGERTLEVYDF